jgi:hypothetical protein
MRPMLLLACSVLLLAGCTDKRESPSRDPQAAASKGRAIFQSLINQQTYEGFGFETVDEAGQIQLGPPMPVFDVPPERLWGFSRGKDANELLVRSFETIYPITVKGQVRSSLTVVQTGKEEYRAAGFGDAALVKQLFSFRIDDKAAAFVVRVLGLHMYFMGQKTQGHFTLTPIYEESRLGLRAGERYEADEVFQRLGQIADKSYPPR